MKMPGIISSILLLVLNVQITSGERCKYVLQNPKGSIKSPGYPSSYPGDLDCSWLIQVQDGYTITLKTDSFRLEGPSPSCEQDSLMIHDGYNESASAFNSPYCERNGPTTLLSTGNSIFIRFTTDSYGSFSGFHIKYSAEPNCNQTINAENGTLSSPRYPANYYSNANCNWNITTKPGTFVLLQFKDFLMEGTKSGIGQCYDYVSIYDVLHSGKHLLKTFCGYKIPGAVKSTNNQMLLTLYSDATVAGRGFLAYFSAQEKVCTEKEFKCREGTCVGKSLKCDGKKDCDDASDETSCKNQMTTTLPIITSPAAIPPCTLKQFKCNNGTCIDIALRCNQEDDCGNGIDESNCADSCSVGNGGCSETCNNHHVWGPYCSCKNGYALDTDKHSCNEIDECRKNNGGCSDICTNFPGGFKCECSSEGYQIGADGKSCQDIDECSANPCSHECQNTNGSYRCKCRIGYRMSSIGNCFDINECAIGVADCHDCINTEGSFYCNCATGFIEVDNSTRCEDVNECKYRNGGCSHNCTNTLGSFNCHCKDGFRPYDKSKRTCLDINECAQNNGGCQHLCVNNQGSYSCKCQPGFELANRTKCIDIDECNSVTTNICQHGCLNTLGSFQCTCAKEYTISANGRTCLKKVNDSDCGLPGSKTPSLSGDRWSIANKGTWAWQAYLSFKFSVFEKVRSGCIATLINRQYLLTTAHCVYLRQGPVAPAQLQVWLGVENRKYSEKKSFAVEKVVIHPDFKNMKTKQNGDLALIRLKHPITTSMTIQPICFNQPQTLPIGAKVHLISWGRISQKRFSEQLRQIKVEIEEQSHCTWLWTKKYNYSKMVCAGFQAANNQICLPDSGSPVMVRSGKKQNWFLVGILAHGAGYPKEKACSSRYKTNAIYDLTHYYRWIVENLSENL